MVHFIRKADRFVQQHLEQNENFVVSRDVEWFLGRIGRKKLARLGTRIAATYEAKEV